MPSLVEVFWLLPLLLTVVCGIGFVVDGSLAGLLGLVALVVAGFVLVAIARVEAPPGDEGVPPGPLGVRVAEGDKRCGSGGCSRNAEVTGDRAREAMRTHLLDHGCTAAPALDGDERMCRRTGLVAVREVCAELEDRPDTSVRGDWYVN